jgi:hypothetical protein
LRVLKRQKEIGRWCTIRPNAELATEGEDQGEIKSTLILYTELNQTGVLKPDISW